jgi:hypothetical protein
LNEQTSGKSKTCTDHKFVCCYCPHCYDIVHVSID